MEKITEATQQKEWQEQQTSSRNSLQKTVNALAIEQQMKSSLSRYAPNTQVAFCANVRDCFLGQHPTLAILKRDFGPKTPEIWLIPQLFDLSEFCGCKDKLSTDQLKQLSRLIADEYHHFRVTEFMLFFQRFKLGRYGRFYGSVDPLVITEALQSFAAERMSAIERYQRQEHTRRREAEAKLAISYSKYKENKTKTTCL